MEALKTDLVKNDDCVINESEIYCFDFWLFLVIPYGLPI